MAEPFLGQIEMFGGATVPRNWLPCDGRVLPVAQYQALYALIGNSFGGTSPTSFALPDLRGHVPMGYDPTNPTWNNVGKTGGESVHMLLVTEMPLHTHTIDVNASAAGSSNAYAAGPTMVLGQSAGKHNTAPVTLDLYVADSAPNQPMSPAALGMQGGGQPHNNMMPFSTVSFCIATSGIFPTRG